jgi:hypothetical protein
MIQVVPARLLFAKSNPAREICLNALQGGIPDKLVDLQAQPGWNCIRQHPIG